MYNLIKYVPIKENDVVYNINRLEIRKCSDCHQDVQAWAFVPLEDGYEYRLYCRGCYKHFKPTEWFSLEILDGVIKWIYYQKIITACEIKEGYLK